MLVRINTRRFEFYSDCPQCGDIDGHSIEQPPPAADETTISIERMRNMQTAFINIIGDRNRRTYGDIWADETNCDVIRTCNKCGEKWPED